jgi:hypothetical protein
MANDDQPATRKDVEQIRNDVEQIRSEFHRWHFRRK